MTIDKTSMKFKEGKIEANFLKNPNRVHIESNVTIDRFDSYEKQRGLKDLFAFLCRVAYIYKHFEKKESVGFLDETEMEAIISELRRGLLKEFEGNIAKWLRAGQIHILKEYGASSDLLGDMYGLEEGENNENTSAKNEEIPRRA